MAVEVTVDENGRDIVGRGFDATVRLSRWMETDAVFLPIGPRRRRTLAASPGYLAGRGTPRSPDELTGYTRLLHRIDTGGRPLRWESKGDHPGIRPHGQLASGDLELVVEAALHDGGVLYVPEPLTRGHLVAGRLVPVLKECWPTLSPVSVFYPGRRQVPAPLRALLTFPREG